MSGDLRGLIDALRAIAGEYGCAAVSAKYVSPLDGQLVELQVTAGGITTIEDEDGNLVAVPEVER